MTVVVALFESVTGSLRFCLPLRAEKIEPSPMPSVNPPGPPSSFRIVPVAQPGVLAHVPVPVPGPMIGPPVGVSRTTEIAPDISVYPRALDPATGRRQVPALAFEVVGTQSLANAADRARRLAARGVRRVFAIDVERNRAIEWSPGIEAWRLLDAGACIEDRVLAVALAVEPLVKAVRMDDAIARALVAKNNPVIAAEKAASHSKGKVEGREQGRAEGRQEGLAHGRQDGIVEGVQRSLLQLLAARGIALDEADRARILAERDLQRLERWLARAVHATSIADALADS